MSIEKKPNAKDQGVKLDSKPKSMADSLVKSPKPAQPSFFKSKTFYGLIAFATLLFAIILYVVIASMNKPEPQTQAIAEQTPEEIQMLQEQAARDDAAAAQAAIDPAIASLPPDDFVFSSEPIKALAYQSTNNVINDIPEYTQNGSEIVTNDGRFLLLSDPYFTQIQTETFNMVEAYTTQNRLLEQRTQSGEESWYIRNGMGFEDKDYVPIQTAMPAAELRATSRNYAAQEMRNKLANAPWQTRQAEIVAAPVAYVDPALSEEERDRLLTILDTQRSNNLELVRKNKELREEKVEVKNKVVDLVQRLEDSSKVGTRLRATMIPPESGWKVSAIVGDRIYLINRDNLMVTLAQGDRLPDSDLIISHADENTGIVLVTPAN